mmetsp:Transcript_16496/g.29786  ORF Transcript_16496/g.29786 Transcript_16496/m.29786 type:complete len:661 (-) Transcript_16496:172-2154(-)|eukprot:CAMPEP_0196135818 /NCGR_PEP_ID=MMETSP0910-20130528/4328_1 /TAXON_ID=49265 /ORGANISM="Thalassiosira rotula, Strain GSO102" /LENGTH=660 /DNA_ID=CAMNT_0041396009 /DNA_START=176 /DNA_END=2158 /DNA_ORIENTATION=-
MSSESWQQGKEEEAQDEVKTEKNDTSAHRDDGDGIPTKAKEERLEGGYPREQCIKKQGFTPNKEEISDGLGLGLGDYPQEDGINIKNITPIKGTSQGELDNHPPANDGGSTLAESQVDAEGDAIDRMVEDLVSKSPPHHSTSDGLKTGNEEIGNNNRIALEVNDYERVIANDSNKVSSQLHGVNQEDITPIKVERPGGDGEFHTNAPLEERPEGDLDTNPPAYDGAEAEVENAIDKMVEDMASESPSHESKLVGFQNGEHEVGNIHEAVGATEIFVGSNDYKESIDGSNNGSVINEGDKEEEETSDDASLRTPYPPPPPGYEHYPPPPGYYPYPPHYPPHPHYGYPPPPPGYYPPPPPGYYPPPGHPHHPLPPQHPLPPGERDPSTGNFIYGGPPPTAAAPAKRSRMRIKTPQDILNRKIRKNAQSRSRAARLREKVDTIKVKGDEVKTEDEARLYHTFEERRARKNNRSRERALEKKAELERITAKPENERTKEEIEILDIAITAKRRKNEGDRLRRERLKKMGLKVKPPGVSIRGRPRKPLSGEPVYKYGNPVPVAPLYPPGVPPMPPPGLPHGGSDTFQYPPPAIPPSYPAMYYNEPPPMKEDNDDRERNDQEGEATLGDRNTDQEVSDLLLQDDVTGNEDHTVDVDMKQTSESVDC